MEYGLNYAFIHGTYWLMRWGAFAAVMYLALRSVDGYLSGVSPLETLACTLGGLVATGMWFALSRLKDEVLRD